ncbi:uncharacterized protein LOC112574334 [Pomacea canaliculata]|uniref:uncharacterized protein LOC112574334 n=1 Tax=Pomacea canaliculata TaxID=400727 RepID=UPI000D7398CF|nr:uncharacterized protein LOC112574334 [Pomacea canaliculata]
MKQLCTALFLLHALLTVSGVENITEGSQDVSCTESEELCLSSNSTATSIYVINTKMSCCAAGYEMAWTDQSCSCKKTKEAIACNTGEDACASAEYAVLDDSGTKRCCPDNSTLQSFRFRLKGKNYLHVHVCWTRRRMGHGCRPTVCPSWTVRMPSMLRLSLVILQ